MVDILDLKLTLLSLAKELGKEISPDKLEIIDRGLPHKNKTLPSGKMAIYMFEYENCFLKIGKAGANSNARFLSQHYSPNSSPGNLAKSLLLDTEMNNNLDESNIKDWILNNARRIDILLDSDLGIFTLNLFEAALHFMFSPKYEGFTKRKHYEK